MATMDYNYYEKIKGSRAYSDPSGEANGTPKSLTNGTALTVFGNSPISVANGFYTHSPSAGTNKAGYLQSDLGVRVGRIGCEFVGIPAVTNAAIALVIPTGNWIDGAFTSAGVHGVFYPNGIWHISYFDGAAETKYVSSDTAGRFSDVRDGKAHAVEIIIDEEESALTVVLPDGRVVRAFSSFINSAPGTRAIWEIYNPDTAIYTSIKFGEIWADSTNPKGGLSAGLSDELILKGISYGNQYLRMVTSLPAVGVGQRGQIVHLQNGAGVADGIYSVMKNSSDTYAWVQIG